MVPAATWGRIPRSSRQVCDRVHVGLTAKGLLFYRSAKRRNWPIASFRGNAANGRFRGIADIGGGRWIVRKKLGFRRPNVASRLLVLNGEKFVEERF